MLVSSLATPSCTSLPASSTTATPVGLRSPHARSSPTKYIRLPCPVARVELLADVVQLDSQGGESLLRVGQSGQQVTVPRRLRCRTASRRRQAFGQSGRDDVPGGEIAVDRHVF